MSNRREEDARLSAESVITNYQARLTMNIGIDDLVEALLDQPEHVLIAMIKELDTKVATFEFTRELRDYFAKEIEDEDD